MKCPGARARRRSASSGTRWSHRRSGPGQRRGAGHDRPVGGRHRRPALGPPPLLDGLEDPRGRPPHGDRVGMIDRQLVEPGEHRQGLSRSSGSMSMPPIVPGSEQQMRRPAPKKPADGGRCGIEWVRIAAVLRSSPGPGAPQAWAPSPWASRTADACSSRWAASSSVSRDHEPVAPPRRGRPGGRINLRVHRDLGTSRRQPHLSADGPRRRPRLVLLDTDTRERCCAR